jgi:molybdopterin-containing oxidoreductase family iron-sulfur binding subunit
VACQEACPADAISFGNLKDEQSATVVRARELARSYELLHYIGTIPRTLYMARVKNPNAKMPDAKFVGTATIHMA